MYKEQILKNIYDSSKTTEKDRKIIEEIFTAIENDMINARVVLRMDELISKYRPDFYEK